MYYEEANIDGRWYYRTTPSGEWRLLLPSFLRAEDWLK